MFSVYSKIQDFILDSGHRASNSIHENKKITLVNGTGLLSGFLLLVAVVWLHYIGVPYHILDYLFPTIILLLLLFLVSRYISPLVAKFSLIILINSTILLGGLISNENVRLQQVLSTWIFSTSGILILIFDLKEWRKILSGCILILSFHLLIVPVDHLLVSGFSPEALDNNTFVSISFVFSMSLLIGSIFFAQKNDIKIYINLVRDLQINNEKLRAQEEELRQSYEELRASREQIFMALETVNEKKGHLEIAMRIAKMGSYHYYFKDDHSDWSEEMKNLLEMEGQERNKPAYYLLDFVHPDDKAMVREEINKAKTDLQYYNLVYRIITAKGNQKTVLSAGYIFKDSYQNSLGIRGVVQDISDYKEIENKLTEANKELENFIYRAYHDIKGPLATIKGICYIASLTVREDTSVSYFKLLKQHTFQLETILSKLLIINELKHLTPRIDPVNIHSLVDDVAGSLKNIQGVDLITLEKEINTPDIIKVDKMFLRLILQNLLDNAFEYRAEESPLVKVNVSFEGSYLIMNVSDNGIGIPEEFYDKIFERYFRVSEKSKGNGLGLYIVKKMSEKLNASIAVNSTPNVKTTFTIKVPYEENTIDLV